MREAEVLHEIVNACFATAKTANAAGAGPRRIALATANERRGRQISSLE
jgi:hypothetical protein